MPKQKGEVFTSLTNETRYEASVKIDKYKKLLDRKDAHRRNAKPKYMRENLIHAAVFDEIKEIVDAKLTSDHNLPSISKSSISRSESSLSSATSPNKSFQRQGSNSSVSSTPYKSIDLPSINERYGHDLVSKWHHGGCAIVQGIKTPYKATVNEKFKDAQARRLHRQTKGLMDGMQQMSRQARYYANYRRNIMDKTMTQGQDHVVESLENYMPEEVVDNSEEIVEAVFAGISAVKRKVRKRVSSRIDEVWSVMQFPVVAKLNLKLQCDEATINSQYMEVVLAFEELCDLCFAIHLMSRLRYAWAEHKLPEIYSKKHVIHMIEANFKGTHLKHYAKKSWEDMPSWFGRLLNESWEQLKEDFDICQGYCAHHNDFALLEHMSTLQQNLRDLIDYKYVPPASMVNDDILEVAEAAVHAANDTALQPTPAQKKMIRGILVEDEATSSIVDITQLKKYYNKKSKNMAPYQQFRESLQRSQSSFMDSDRAHPN